MIWEVYQQTKIAGAERTAERAMSKADRYAADIADVRRLVDRLTLACQAMWELLRDRSDLTEEDIEAKILEIDARDGRVDGKIATSREIIARVHCGLIWLGAEGPAEAFCFARAL